VGSRIHVGEVAGTGVEVIQKTDYPWKGSVAITVNPEKSQNFSIHVRIPNRTTSKLYHDSPEISGLKSFSVNGEALKPEIRKGYAVVTREWKAGDRIEFELPMEPQRVTADSRIHADAQLVALKYGPLVYNVETVDNQNIERKIGDAPLHAEWKPDLLGGVMVIEGNWSDGSKLVAIPNYARMNRVGPPHPYPSDEEVNTAFTRRHEEAPSIQSKVWA
jgi:uncharacterized protein